MSHPVGISCRWQRTISRMRRRMRLRTTAPPNAFLMLNPNRLIGCPLARTNTVKWELERRLPARYTLSNSLFRTNRNARGNVWPAAGPCLLLWCEAMTTLLAARRKHFAATFGLHAHAKPVRLSAAAFPRLICTLWQSSPPLSSLYPALSLNRSQIRPRESQTPARWRLDAANSPQVSRWLSDLPGPATLPNPGRLRNLLVYLPPAHRVKKTHVKKRSVELLGGSCLFISDLQSIPAR